MIAVICSECKEGFLGLDENSCTFQEHESVKSKQFFKLTPVGWAPVGQNTPIECPNCKCNILKDIIQIWKEEKDRRSKHGAEARFGRKH